MSNSSTIVQLAASGAATLVTSYSLMEKVSQASLIEHLFVFLFVRLNKSSLIFSILPKHDSAPEWFQNLPIVNQGLGHLQPPLHLHCPLLGRRRFWGSFLTTFVTHKMPQSFVMALEKVQKEST